MKVEEFRSDRMVLPCEICGTATPVKNGITTNKIFFPDYADDNLMTMVHGACVRAEVKSHNLRIVADNVIESLQLYCRHFGNRTMPNKIGDDEDA